MCCMASWLQRKERDRFNCNFDRERQNSRTHTLHVICCKWHLSKRKTEGAQSAISTYDICELIASNSILPLPLPLLLIVSYTYFGMDLYSYTYMHTCTSHTPYIQIHVFWYYCCYFVIESAVGFVPTLKPTIIIWYFTR